MISFSIWMLRNLCESLHIGLGAESGEAPDVGTERARGAAELPAAREEFLHEARQGELDGRQNGHVRDAHSQAAVVHRGAHEDGQALLRRVFAVEHRLQEAHLDRAHRDAEPDVLQR